MGIIDIKGLILKYFSQKHALIRNFMLIFSQKVQLSLVQFIIHITHVKKKFTQQEYALIL